MLAAESAAGPIEGPEGEQSSGAGGRRRRARTFGHARTRRSDRWRRAAPRTADGCRRSQVAQAAIATGDLLFSRAFAELARNRDPEQLRALSDASSALAAGELLQREDAYAADVAVERYLERCRLKTAALFEAACRLGALVAVDGTAELAAPLGQFAERIGLAFQLLDDVLDVSGPAERTGKARGTDLLDGTVTLPLILARERDEQIASLDLATLAGPAEAEALCEQIAATGALETARSRALSIVAEAKAMLALRATAPLRPAGVGGRRRRRALLLSCASEPVSKRSNRFQTHRHAYLKLVLKGGASCPKSRSGRSDRAAGHVRISRSPRPCLRA